MAKLKKFFLKSICILLALVCTTPNMYAMRSCCILSSPHEDYDLCTTALFRELSADSPPFGAIPIKPCEQFPSYFKSQEEFYEIFPPIYNDVVRSESKEHGQTGSVYFYDDLLEVNSGFYLQLERFALGKCSIGQLLSFCGNNLFSHFMEGTSINQNNLDFRHEFFDFIVRLVKDVRISCREDNKEDIIAKLGGNVLIYLTLGMIRWNKSIDAFRSNKARNIEVCKNIIKEVWGWVNCPADIRPETFRTNKKKTRILINFHDHTEDEGLAKTLIDVIIQNIGKKTITFLAGQGNHSTYNICRSYLVFFAVVRHLNIRNFAIRKDNLGIVDILSN